MSSWVDRCIILCSILLYYAICTIEYDRSLPSYVGISLVHGRAKSHSMAQLYSACLVAHVLYRTLTAIDMPEVPRFQVIRSRANFDALFVGT